MTINVSIEARMTSSRLPGKTLKLINGKPSLEIMLDRIKKAKLIDNIIVATTINKGDDVIVDLCKKKNVKYFRGSEHNVYDRVLKAHQQFNTDIIVELTGDCILLDADLVDMAIQRYLDNDYDYISLSTQAGMGAQVYSLKVLESVSDSRELEYQDREHVTPYIYTSSKYNISKTKAYQNLDCPDMFLSLDTIEDWEVLDNICKNFNDFYFSFEDIVEFAKNNPDKVNLNRQIPRKGLS